MGADLASAPSPLGEGALARCTAVPAEEFAAASWSRTPLLTRAKELPRDFGDLLSVEDVDVLVSERGLRDPFFRVVREGGGLRTPLRTVTAGNRRIGDLVDTEGLRAAYDGGATLVLQSLHRLHPPVGRFCRTLAAELGHPTQCNAYVTPAGDAQGFDFHHDTHDVFVLQVSGRKRWIVHEPVTRLPLASMPEAGDHLVTEGAEPLLDVELEAGDCLYLPRGYVHAALTTDEHSVHLTIGVLSTTWFDVLQEAVSLAGEVEGLRDALPVQPLASYRDDLPRVLREAAAWLEQLPPERVAERVDRRLAGSVPAEPLGVLAPAAQARALGPATRLRPRHALLTRLSPADSGSDGTVVLGLPDRRITLPEVCREALALLLAGPVAVADLAVGGLDVDDACVLARRMVREGVSVPAGPSD